MKFADQLHAQLMPGKIHSRIENLLIIPSGSLGLIPFEALLNDPDTQSGYSDHNYLLNQYNISYQYSASLYYQQAQSSSTVKANAVLFAPVDFKYENQVQLASLPGTEKEVRSIGGIMASMDFNTRELLFDEASEEEIKSEGLREFDILHIASHGVVNEQHPELTCIYLASNGGSEDGILYSGEIYGLDLNANLVTMSACQTGMGRVSKGEGIIGLSRALLFAGARNIVVSLWKVNDESTSELMTSFYDGSIVGGHNFSRALSEAKRELMKNPGTSNPYHWASFILIGDGK